VIAVGWETARAHAAALGGRAIDVIPNAVGELPPIAEGERDELRRQLGIGDATPLVIAVGRLAPQKALSDLLRAFALLRTPDPTPQLRIVGRGRLRSALQSEIDALGLRDRVRLLGLRSDVPRLLAASDLYVSSSHWEGLPVAMLEAMAAGVPVIATEVGDVPRVLDPGCGVLVPPRDPAALARAIAELIADPVRRRRLAAGGRSRVRAQFGLQAWADRHMMLYEEVAGLRPRTEELLAREEARCAS
jgi:glycosyltransferase involved in cell wall biosynthesis